MSTWQIIRRSLLHHWRIHLAVGLGVAAATAVLTGALLVGDSVRGSLKELTLGRLGKIDAILVADRFFRRDLADELARADGFAPRFTATGPAIIFPRGTVEMRANETVRRASQVLVVGSEPSFWDLGTAR